MVTPDAYRTHRSFFRTSVAATLALTLALSACDQADPTTPELTAAAFAKGGNPGGPGETVGNNLSFPVIWAEAATKTLRGTMGTVLTDGAWWWWWGPSVTEQGDPLSCPPDPDNEEFCDDNIPGSVGPAPGAGAVNAYLQKDALNEWQATNSSATEPVVVDVIDWGDALESVPWYLNSQVRIETTLYKTLAAAVTEYRMERTSGWGASEVWGLIVDNGVVQLGPGTEATVFTPCARLTMQKLRIAREAPELAALQWSTSLHQWVEPVGAVVDLISPPFFNRAVHEALDGPGYYNAEVNVKGMIIYGYTWNVRQANEGAGDYRLTYSFDGTCPTVGGNTLFVDGTTTILVPEEEGEIVVAEVGGGGTAVLRPDYNLTYIDISILSQKGGGGKKGGRGN